MSVIHINPGSTPIIPIDWTDVLPTGVVLSSVSHSVPSPLTLDSEGNSTTSSWAKFNGQLHAGVYLLEAVAVLDNGETIKRPVTLVSSRS